MRICCVLYHCKSNNVRFFGWSDKNNAIWRCLWEFAETIFSPFFTFSKNQLIKRVTSIISPFVLPCVKMLIDNRRRVSSNTEKSSCLHYECPLVKALHWQHIIYNPKETYLVNTQRTQSTEHLLPWVSVNTPLWLLDWCSNNSHSETYSTHRLICARLWGIDQCCTR